MRFPVYRIIKNSYDHHDNTKKIPRTELHLISWSRHLTARNIYLSH